MVPHLGQISARNGERAGSLAVRAAWALVCTYRRPRRYRGVDGISVQTGSLPYLPPQMLRQLAQSGFEDDGAAA